MKKQIDQELKLIINHITTPKYDSVDYGVELLIKSGNKNYFEQILSNTRIINGCLIASYNYTATAPRQPYVDYALWNIIGQMPIDINVHSSLLKHNIKKVTISKYESYFDHYNKMKKFPIGLTYLNNIENLDLSDAQFDKIPIEIARLIKLKIINIKGNWLKEFPVGLCQIKTLNEINLDMNNIIEIPTEIAELSNLKYLSLKSNQIISIPSSIKYLNKLKHLFLNGNNLKELPKELFELINLTKIQLFSNSLNSIPYEINNLKNLTILNLSYNNLKTIPKLNLLSLKVLCLSSNKFETVGSEVSGLLGLEKLDLENNRELKFIEPDITALNNLKELNLCMMPQLLPKPYARYILGRDKIEIYFSKINNYYKLDNPFKAVAKENNIKAKKSKYNSSFHYRENDEVPPKGTESIISNLSNYFDSRDINTIDVGINLMTNLANQSVYNYIFGKWKIVNGELDDDSYNNGYVFNYDYKKYIVFKLLSTKNNDIKIIRNITIENITKLKYDFSRGRYPDFLFTFYNLNTVNFDLNNLELTDSFYNLVNLKEIKLNKVSNIDNLQFDKFSDLRKLEVSDVKRKLSFSFSNMSNLTELIIKDVNIRSLSILNNNMLEEITICDSKIEKIEILNCNKLKKIKFDDCYFEDGQNLSHFPELREIIINRTNISNLMSYISNCISLEIIEIHNIDGFKLDKTIANLKNLKILHLIRNRIDFIPDEIGELLNLESLSIRSNSVKKIPESLSKCRNLISLNLRCQGGTTKADNMLKDIPLEIFTIPKLNEVYVTWTSLNYRKFISKLLAADCYNKSSVITND